ncbi:uncharacterized protein LOC110374111 isoform X1 [Helicoverpa armigera]|uniref:uncharacterized protein LOC110374111 isoform X1 n=1 Tax=Helicoverpa armigera TaxID=29058 RepID=UPI003083B223
MEAKKNKIENKKFPKNALSFYIKLYCKHKGSSKSKYQSLLLEATKSWLSLSEEEKLQLNKTYKDSEHKFKQQLLDKLANAEPFMKIKDEPRFLNGDTNRSNTIVETSEGCTSDVHEDIESHKQNENAEEINLGCDEESSTYSSVQQCVENDNETIQETANNNEQGPRLFIPEPLPPTLKNSKDLFFMLNSADADSNVSWTTLPASEKNEYRRAVSLVKKDYITKYREFLESLSSKELFDHYNKTLF